MLRPIRYYSDVVGYVLPPDRLSTDMLCMSILTEIPFHSHSIWVEILESDGKRDREFRIPSILCSLRDLISDDFGLIRSSGF